MSQAIIPLEIFNVARLEETTLPDTFDGMVALMKEAGMAIDHASAVLPEEFPEVDKKDLINKKLLLTTWSVSDADKSDFGRQYIVVRGITSDGKRFRFADGSTGIFRQLAGLTEQRVKEGHKTPNAGLLVEGGLTVSEYDYKDPATGKTTKAKTYYLSAS